MVHGKLKYQLAVSWCQSPMSSTTTRVATTAMSRGNIMTQWILGSHGYPILVKGSLGELVAGASPMVRWVFPWFSHEQSLLKLGFSTKPPLIARGYGWMGFILIQLLTGGSSVLNHRILRRSQGDERYPSSLVLRWDFWELTRRGSDFCRLW